MSEQNFEARLSELLKGIGEKLQVVQDAYKLSRDNLHDPSAQMKYLEVVMNTFPDAVQRFAAEKEEYFVEQTQRLKNRDLQNETIASIILGMADEIKASALTGEHLKPLIDAMRDAQAKGEKKP